MSSQRRQLTSMYATIPFGMRNGETRCQHQGWEEHGRLLRVPLEKGLSDELGMVDCYTRIYIYNIPRFLTFRQNPEVGRMILGYSRILTMLFRIEQ